MQPCYCATSLLLYREVLVAKIAHNELKEVLSEAIKIVNFIKTCPVNSRIIVEMQGYGFSTRSFAIAH